MIATIARDWNFQQRNARCVSAGCWKCGTPCRACSRFRGIVAKHGQREKIRGKREGPGGGGRGDENDPRGSRENACTATDRGSGHFSSFHGAAVVVSMLLQSITGGRGGIVVGLGVRRGAFCLLRGTSWIIKELKRKEGQLCEWGTKSSNSIMPRTVPEMNASATKLNGLNGLWCGEFVASVPRFHFLLFPPRPRCRGGRVLKNSFRAKENSPR